MPHPLALQRGRLSFTPAGGVVGMPGGMRTPEQELSADASAMDLD